MSDERFGDGLADSIHFQWDGTPQIDDWSCDALVGGGWGIAGQLNFTDSGNDSGMIDWLLPGYYDVCAYGLGADGTYLDYELYANVTIMREYAYSVHLPAYVASGVLYMVNLETGQNTSIEISGNSANISFVAPTLYEEGDRILLTLVSDGSTTARGLIVLSGDAADVYLEEVAQPASMVNILLFLLAAGLIIFAFVKLIGVERSSLKRLSIKLRRR